MKGVQMANEGSAADAVFRLSVFRDQRSGPADFFRSARTRMNPVFRDRIAWKLVNKTPHNSL
jgi:hypothetical protein